MKTLLLLALAGIVLAVSAVSGQAVTLTLKALVKVNGDSFTVGDLVAADQTIPGAVSTLSLGATPALNEHQIVTRDVIESAILTARPDLGPVTWFGADKCEVEHPARLVAPQSLNAAIVAELQRATDGKGEVRVEEFAQAAPILLPVGQIGAQVELPTTSVFHPWVTATIIYYVDGERVATAPLRFRWSWNRDVWQAVRSLNVGDDYNPSDFRQTSIDAIKADGNYLADLPAVEDLMIGRRIAAGAIVVEADLVPKKIVQRGEPVTVNYVQSNFKVSMKGVALQDGARGEVISVKNSLSQRSLFAKVVDASTLEIVQ